MMHYSLQDVVAALRATGVGEGDTVFSHSNIGFFGFPEHGKTATDACKTVYHAFQLVLGPSGTLVVPTFTYSFPRKEVFAPGLTPSACGIFAEFIRMLPQAIRSEDPIFSVSAIGMKAEDLTQDLPLECFGRDSFWQRLHRADGIICNLNLDAASTFIHYVEKCLNVPYRRDKEFTGFVRKGNETHPKKAIYFCRDLNRPDLDANFETFDELARKKAYARSAHVGRGSVVAIRAQKTFDLIEETLKVRPFFLTNAEAMGIAPDLDTPLNV